MGGDGSLVWRASLEDVHTGERQAFADPMLTVAFLAETVRRLSKVDPRTTATDGDGVDNQENSSVRTRKEQKVMKRYAVLSVSVLLFALVLGGCQPLPMPVETAPEPEIFVRGAALPGIFDVAAGPDGLVYVASELERALIAIDPETGKVIERYDVGNDTPHAMAIAPDGSLYWSSFYSLNLCRFDEAGEKVCQAMPVDTWGLDFAPDGRLFATADAHVESLYEVDPLLEVVAAASGPSRLADLTLRVGPDGHIYAPLLLEGSIIRVDVDADPVTTETVVEGLTLPSAVDFDSSGQMYVAVGADGEHNEILLVDLSTGEREVVGRLPAGFHNITFDAADRLFVSHFDEGALYELLPDGELNAITEPGMIAPGGLAVRARPDGGESLFVAGWSTLHELDGVTGAPLNAWRTSWFPGAVVPPRTVALHGDNLLTLQVGR